MQDEVTVARVGIRTEGSGIDAQDAVGLLDRGTVGVPVERDGTVALLRMGGEPRNTALYTVFVPVTAQNAHALFLDDVFLHTVRKIAVAAQDDRLLGMLAQKIAQIGLTVAEMYDKVVFRKERRDLFHVLAPPVRIGNDDERFHNFASSAFSALPRWDTAFFSASSASAKLF